ncbi:MAG: GTPase, partial [Chloroflexi bacterium]|nr:GTPase [Chloroflexota bacterium]
MAACLPDQQAGDGHADRVQHDHGGLWVKNEKQDRRREINERQLRGQFESLRATIATNLSDNRGLADVVNEIKHHLGQLPQIGTPLPKSWVAVRERLERDTRDYISLDEYLSFCDQAGFEERGAQLRLSEYLHDIGVILHFQDDPVLNNTVILNPTWGTGAAFKVLDNEEVKDHLGRFSRSDLEDIWSEPEYVGKHNDLLQLLINFHLCYEIPGNPGHYIAPQLLSDNQPDYPWEERDNLILRYVSPEFMPKGIITRLIVAMHQDIEEQARVWRGGLVLFKDQTRAEVIEDYGRREIRIRVEGLHKKALMTIVTYVLDGIYETFHGLEYDKPIPCKCSQCKGSQTPYFYEFERLRWRIANEEFPVQC